MRVHAETREVALGASAIVELPGHGTAGYAWQVSAPPGVKIERRLVPPPEDAPMGQSAQEVFELAPSEPGTAKVTFELRQIGEATPVERRTVTLVSRQRPLR